MSNLSKKYFEYSGIIHIHSTYSDGSLPIPKIAKIANELDVNFLLFTDHNTLQPKFDGLEGWYGKILVGVGCEINDVSDMNHYLAFDIDEEISSELAPNEYVCRVREKGGFGIIAHPDEKRTAMPEYPPYPWTVWDSDCYDGIEIWNQMSEWMEGLTHSNKYWRAVHPRKSILAPNAEALSRWDEVNLRKKILGIGGVDAHGHIYKLWGLFRITIFRYKVLFKTIRTHVLLPEPLSDRKDYLGDLKKIYDAMRNANVFISNHYIGDAGSFLAWLENNNDQVIIGETITLDEKTKLCVKNPLRAKTILIKNGIQFDHAESNEIEFKISEPGVYRVESHLADRPWIYSNHLRVVDKK